MGHTLTVELSDDVYAAIERRAAEANTSPAQIVVESLEQSFRHRQRARQPTQARSEAELQAVRAHFERHFGAVDLGYPTGVENASIDADLARAYSDTHEAA